MLYSSIQNHYYENDFTFSANNSQLQYFLPKLRQTIGNPAATPENNVLKTRNRQCFQSEFIHVAKVKWKANYAVMKSLLFTFTIICAKSASK